MNKEIITVFVSPTGSDNNSGGKASPFRTLSRAQEESRKLRLESENIRVQVLPGTYRETLSFTSKDNGVFWLGDGAALTGGISIPWSDTSCPETDVAERLSPEAAKHVRMIDLSSLGVNADSYRDVYAVGGSTAAKYDDYRDGNNIEVFEDGTRMALSRYPNEGYLKINAVLDVGEPGEFPTYNYWYDTFNSLRNPRGGTYIVDPETNERIKTWKNPLTVWMFGYFFWDWADSSTPLIKADVDHHAVYPKFVSKYGCKEGARYYFYNILEELDAQGEYYIDREKGKLYVYAKSENSVFDVSLTEKPLVNIEGASGVSFSGFTLVFTRENAVSGYGDNNVLSNLIIKDVAGNGVELKGSGNIVERCDISHTAKGGIYLTGGDRASLTPGENIVRDNRIHDYAEIYRIHQPGVLLSGVGNICTHNEIYNAPHDAVNYNGNLHLIEHNYIHHVEQEASDAGAIYSGRDWAAHGTVIRYNLLRDLGNERVKPVAIYWDDALSGQTAYGNVIIDPRGKGFLIGGGHDHNVYNNVVCGDCEDPLYYDARERDNFIHGYGSHTSCDTLQGCDWVNLFSVPYKSEVWAKKFPTLAMVITDFNRRDDPNFPINPSHSIVKNNIIVNASAKLGFIEDSVYEYSKINDNLVYHTTEEAGFDMQTLRFNPSREGFDFIMDPGVRKSNMG